MLKVTKIDNQRSRNQDSNVLTDITRQTPESNDEAQTEHTTLSTNNPPSKQCGSEPALAMGRFMEEHDRHLSSLITAKFDEKQHASARVEELSRLDHQLRGSDRQLDPAEHDEAVAAMAEELDHLRQAWDDMNAENEDHKENDQEG